jgi:O-antigen/teichoic acid export membrane protein
LSKFTRWADALAEEVRIQYSGLIIFTAKMISVATGMIFTLLITRNTTKDQFGIWGNINDLLGYFLLLAAAIPFWSTRFVARNKEGSTKTGLLANLIIGIVSTAFYIPLVPFLTSALNVTQGYLILYFMVSAQIIESHLINQLEATLRVEKPQAIGYGLLVEEIAKVALAYTLIVRLQQPLIGAMISLIFAILAQIIYYVRLVSPSLKQKTRRNYIREWLKGSIANIYYLIGNQIAATIFIMLFVLGSHGARADYLGASTISNIITYSSFLSFALYPKLLARKNIEDITVSLKLVLMFAIPMVAGVIAIPESLLIILNQSYAEAAPLLIILAADALVATISGFYQNVFFGVERLDEESTIPIRQLVRSNIFKVFTLSYIHAAITLPLAYYVLTSFAAGQTVQAAIYVAAITMGTRLAMFLVLYALVRRAISLSVPWTNIGKYVLVAAMMGIILYLIPHQTRLLLTLGTVALGGLLYVTLLAYIDKEARNLIKSVIQEIKRLISQVMHRAPTTP